MKTKVILLLATAIAALFPTGTEANSPYRCYLPSTPRYSSGYGSCQPTVRYYASGGYCPSTVRTVTVYHPPVVTVTVRRYVVFRSGSAPAAPTCSVRRRSCP